MQDEQLRRDLQELRIRVSVRADSTEIVVDIESASEFLPVNAVHWGCIFITAPQQVLPEWFETLWQNIPERMEELGFSVVEEEAGTVIEWTAPREDPLHETINIVGEKPRVGDSPFLTRVAAHGFRRLNIEND